MKHEGVIGLVAAFTNNLSFIEISYNSTRDSLEQDRTINLTNVHRKNIISIDWSVDGLWMMTTSEDLVCIWTYSFVQGQSEIKCVSQIPSQGGKISSSLFLPRMGAPLVAFGEYQNVYLWEVPISPSFAHVPYFNVSAHKGVVASICSGMSARGVFLVVTSSGDRENNLKIWCYK